MLILLFSNMSKNFINLKIPKFVNLKIPQTKIVVTKQSNVFALPQLCYLYKERFYSFENSQILTSSNSQIAFVVENNGFEPLTPCVQGRCSSQLS